MSNILTKALEDRQQVFPDTISGQIGSALETPITGPQLLLFNVFWTQGRGITFDSGTRRFTVSKGGLYRITGNFFKLNSASNARVTVGVNTDTPTHSTHYGHAYADDNTADFYSMMSIDTMITLNAGDYVVFYLEQGSLYNYEVDNRFNEFTISRIGT